MNKLVRSNDIVAATREINPLDQLPPELVQPASEFYAFFSDSLKGVVGIAFRLSWWIKPREEGGEGLAIEDAIAAMRNLMKPNKAGLAQYAGQVQAALAVEIEEVLKTRRAKDAERRRKDEVDREKTETAKPSEIRKLLSSIGKPKD